MGLISLLKQFFGLEKPEPEGKYIVGVSLGPKYGALISEKLGRGTGIGVNFFEPYITSPRSLTPNEVDNVKHACKRFDANLSLHDGTNAKICTADKNQYEEVQETIKEYIDKVKDVNAKWILFHSSSQLRPRYIERGGLEMRRADLVDETGKTIKKDKLDPNKSPQTRKWFKEKYGERLARDEINRRLEAMRAREETVKREEVEEMVEEAIEKSIDEWDCVGSEMMAYNIMAHWMYFNNDYLWEKIAEGKDPESDDLGELERDAAVAGKYLEGQLKNALDKCKKKDVKILIENTHGDPKRIGLMRLTKPDHIYYVIKSINDPHIRMCVDFEHMTIHGLIPEEELEKYPGDFGEYVESTHLSKPNPEHQHIPIERGNIYVYEILWKLRNLDFDEGYLIFEPGGQELKERVQQTIFSLKEMSKYLSRNIHPDDLPEEYFGLTESEMEHEKRIVESHAFDPLKGLIHSPELTDTFFGTEMARRRELEKWAKEEWR